MKTYRETYKGVDIYQTIDVNKNGHSFVFNDTNYGAWVSVVEPSEKALEEHWGIHLEMAKEEIDKLYEETI